MLKTIGKQFEIRKKDIALSFGAFTALSIAVAIITALVLPYDGVAVMKYLGIELIMAMYFWIRCLLGFASYGTYKSLSVGFGETRGRFLVGFYLISAMQCIAFFMVTFISKLISDLIFNLRLENCPASDFEMNIKLAIIIVLTVPAIELFIGSIYERFGYKAFWGSFLVMMAFMAIASRAEEIFGNGIVEQMVRVAYIIWFVVYAIIITANFLLNRKSEVR